MIFILKIYNATLTFKNHEPLHLTDTIKCTLISVCLLLKEEDFERLIISIHKIYRFYPKSIWDTL